MTTTQLGILLAVILFAAIIVRINRLKKIKNEDEYQVKTTPEESLEDLMQELFFEKVSNGAEKLYFLDVKGSNAIQNLMVLKNLFQSENIPYYSEFERFNAVYGGIVTSIKFYILNENYDQALNIVNNYTKTTNISGIMVIDNGV